MGVIIDLGFCEIWLLMHHDGEYVVLLTTVSHFPKIAKFKAIHYFRIAVLVTEEK